MPDFYPSRLTERITWHTNFALQCTSTGTTHGLTAGQVTQINTDSTVLAGAVGYIEQAQAFAQAVTEWKDLLLDGPAGTALPPLVTIPAAIAYPAGTPLASIQLRTRQYANLIKASVGYTDEIGALYGIIPVGATVLPTVEVTARALVGSEVELTIKKGGYAGLAVDSRRGGSAAWEQIGVSLSATYVDSRPPLVVGQPEVREYRVQGLDGNARVGDPSDTVSVSTTP